MVLNRSLACYKLLRRTPYVANNIFQQSARSHGDWVYRSATKPPKINIILAEIAGGIIWGWIIYHLISEPGHIFGEVELPDPSKWTDAELGIPPDDAE